MWVAFKYTGRHRPGAGPTGVPVLKTCRIRQSRDGVGPALPRGDCKLLQPERQGMAILPTRARRLAMAAALAVVAGACSSDPSGPTTFSASGTSSDVAAMQAAMNSSVMSSFGVAIAGLDSVSGPGFTAPLAALAVGTNSGAFPGAAAYTRKLMTLVPGSTPAGLTRAGGIPDSLKGTTWVYDSATAGYVVSDQSGAPSTGVRFILYAVDPVSHGPAFPLNAIGYADLTDESSGSTQSARLVVVSGSTPYLDYRVSGTALSNGGTVVVAGFITDGTTRLDFNLTNHLTYSSNSVGLTMVYQATVPSRGVSLGFTFTFSIGSNSVAATVNLNLTGPNGNVTLEGADNGDGTGSTGQYTVRVNGNVFATINTTADQNGSSTTITGQSGGALTTDEQQALTAVFDMVTSATDVFTQLLDPVSAWFS